MREILFKAKRADNKKWVHGYFYEECGRTYIIEDRQKESMLHRNLAQKAIPETVCQYTGLNDKNGVKVFEGDILKTDDGGIVEVRYESIYASFGIWKEGWAFLHYFHEAVEPENCEVIGNIHDKTSEIPINK